jgi:Tfp pilus assembly protein PilV
VLISFSLMFIGLLGLLGMQVVAMRANSDARSMTEATGLAQDKLESLRHLPYASLYTRPPQSLEPQLDATGAVATGGAYTRTTAGAVNGSLVTLAVQVTWSGFDGRSHAVTMRAVRGP